MIDCLTVARYFIIKAYQDGIEAEMTNMKVQKLLYYAQSLYLAMYDQQLFPEEIQAWRYGPVCPPAYRFYSEFEAKQLPIPSQESLSEMILEGTLEYVTLLKEFDAHPITYKLFSVYLYTLHSILLEMLLI